MSLEFYTNEELIKELLSRTTFAGIIVKPQGPIEEVKQNPYVEFDMVWTPVLPTTTVEKLLEEALIKLRDDNA